MPASSGVGVMSGHIESSLRASLGGGSQNVSSIDQKLVSSAKRVLLHNIDFEQAQNDSSFQLDSLRTKYKPLNPSKPGTGDNATNGGNATNAGKNGGQHMQKINSINAINGHAPKAKVASSAIVSIPNDGIPKPAVVLFPMEKVQLEWKNMRGAWVGLRNNNNNCYLNSVLQCLTYTPPLVNYLYSNDHTYKCKQTGFCMMCELQRHIKRCLDQPKIPNRDSTISPQAILGKIKMIAKHLSYGRQEDAHEFLRYVVEALQKSCLHGHPEKLDRFSKDTTVVNQIFGGYLRSQVMCLKCKERSNTYDPLLDISLDIKNANTVQRAFERFVQPETLDNDNAYNCPRCKAKVPAQKRFTVHRPPNILTIQLKRFDYNRMCGGKVTRQVMYQEKLDLRPYMSHTQGPPVLYQLYAVLTHVGHSASSGHYYCNIRAPNKQWYTMNDQHVSQTGFQRVLNTEAYLLFYCRINPKINNQYDVQKTMIGPKLPPGHKLQNQEKKPLHSELSNDAGSPVVRKENAKPIAIQRPTISLPSTKAAGDAPTPLISAPKPTAIPLSTQREKVSFGITKPKQNENSAGTDKNNPPRIVMHIKNGKVFFPGGKEDPAQKKVNGNETKAKLVPYNDDSSNSEEEETLVIKPPVPNINPAGKDKKSSNNSNGVVFDKRLNATTVVPGSYKPLDTGSQLEGSMPKPRETSPTKHLSGGKFTSPLSRSVSDSLSVVTNTGSQHRVNATTNWNILDQDAAISPSLASGSSNTSINSTTEWQVTPGPEKRTKSAINDPHCNGWTVTPVKDKGMLSNGIQGSESDKESGCPNGEDVLNSTPHKELNITIKKQPHNGGWESKPKNSDLFMAEFPELEETNKSIPSSKTGANIITNGSSKQEESLVNSSSVLVNGHSESPDSQDSSDHKKHKKKKKHKRERSEDDSEGHVNGCGASDLLQLIKKKKKKKKHKHRDSDREQLLSTSDSDSSRKGSKRSSSSDDDDSQHKKRKESNEKDDYVWVEKKCDTIEKEKPQKKEAPVQSWDHHIKDGFKRRSEENAVKTKSAWDGMRSKSDTVLAEMKKSSFRGYGNQVSSWDGGKSSVDHDADRDRRHERKRDWNDDYEDELDRGRTKKVKSYSDGGFNNYTHNQGGNAFQKMADMRRAGSDRDGHWQQNKYERSDRPYYSSSHHYGYDSYRDNNHRDNGHRDNYRSHNRSHYNSHRDSGGYHGNKRRDRYH